MIYPLRSIVKAALLAAAFVLPALTCGAQKTPPPKTADTKAAVSSRKVTRIDIEGLKPLLKTNGKPLLINFWATWCDPCREEFPDLVKVDTAYRGKIDFITVSLDDLEDIATAVPKFLDLMKAEMPAYLLKTPDESAAIALVSSDWAGNLPLTILYDGKGVVAYQRAGKVRLDTLTENIEKVLAPQKTAP